MPNQPQKISDFPVVKEHLRRLQILEQHRLDVRHFSVSFTPRLSKLGFEVKHSQLLAVVNFQSKFPCA